MNTIRQYLKQKVARSFTGKRIDMDVVKKELKDEITHILYDQTRRTPIIIPVINEIGGGGQNRGNNGGERGGNQRRQDRPQDARGSRPTEPKKFPEPVSPDTEANDTKARQAQDSRPY